MKEFPPSPFTQCWDGSFAIEKDDQIDSLYESAIELKTSSGRNSVQNYSRNFSIFPIYYIHWTRKTFRSFFRRRLHWKCNLNTQDDFRERCRRRGCSIEITSSNGTSPLTVKNVSGKIYKSPNLSFFLLLIINWNGIKIIWQIQNHVVINNSASQQPPSQCQSHVACYRGPLFSINPNPPYIQILCRGKWTACVLFVTHTHTDSRKQNINNHVPFVFAMLRYASCLN